MAKKHADKKYLILGAIGVLAVAVSLFSFINALALEDYEIEQLKQLKTECGELKKTYKASAAQIKARQKDGSLTPAQAKEELKLLNERRLFTCRGAAGGPLTSPVDNCKFAKKYYKQNTDSSKAKGLSLQLSAEDIKRELKLITDDRNYWCKWSKWKVK